MKHLCPGEHKKAVVTADYLAAGIKYESAFGNF